MFEPYLNENPEYRFSGDEAPFIYNSETVNFLKHTLLLADIFAVKTVICCKFLIDRQRKTGPGMIGLCQALFFIGCFLLNSRSTENVIYLNLNYKTLLLVKINGSFGVRIQIIGDFSS